MHKTNQPTGLNPRTGTMCTNTAQSALIPAEGLGAFIPQPYRQKIGLQMRFILHGPKAPGPRLTISRSIRASLAAMCAVSPDRGWSHQVPPVSVWLLALPHTTPPFLLNHGRTSLASITSTYHHMCLVTVVANELGEGCSIA